MLNFIDILCCLRGKSNYQLYLLKGKNSSYNFPSIHPTIKKHIGKTVKRSASTSGTESTPTAVQESASSEETTTKVTEVSSRSNEEQVVKVDVLKLNKEMC